MLKYALIAVTILIFGVFPLYELPFLAALIWITASFAAIHFCRKTHAQCMQTDDTRTAYLFGASSVFVLGAGLATFGMPSFGASEGHGFMAWLGRNGHVLKILVELILGSAVVAGIFLPKIKSGLALEREKLGTKPSGGEVNSWAPLADYVQAATAAFREAVNAYRGSAIVPASESTNQEQTMGLFSKPTAQADIEPVAQPKPPGRPRIDMGGLSIPHSLEHRGWLLSGAPGTGKTVVITGMLDTLIARGDSGFVADRSGIYLSRYYNPQRDVILSPLDARGIDWSPLSEFEDGDNYSAQTIAQSIIPDGSGESAQWNAGAQVALTAILEHCFDNHLTNADIFRLAVRADLDELSQIFAGKAAEAQVAPGNEKMFGSIRAIIAAYIMPYQRLAPHAGRHSFSIKKHIKAGNQGWLFFNYTTPQMMPLRKILCAMADIWCEAVMTLPPDETRRQWLVLDEFSSIGRMNGIANYVANARKHGGCSILGVQSIYQGYDEYTENTFLGMISSLNNQLILRTADGKTAEYLSNNLGNRQESRYSHSTNSSQGSSNQGSSSNVGESYAQQVVVEKNFLEGELLSLPDLRAVIKLSGAVKPTVISLALPERRPAVAEPFVAKVKPQVPPAPAKAPATPPQAPAADAAGLDDLAAAVKPAAASGIDL